MGAVLERALGESRIGRIRLATMIDSDDVQSQILAFGASDVD